MWIAILEAYNRSIDVAFRILDWIKGRPKGKLEDQRKEWEDKSREAQLKGDLHGMQEARGRIEEIDRQIKSIDSSK